MQQGQAARICSMVMQQVYVAETYSMEMRHGTEAWTCSVECSKNIDIDMHRQAGWTCMDMKHGCERKCSMEKHQKHAVRQHGHSAKPMDIQHGHAAWRCNKDMQNRLHGHSERPMDIQHGHAAWI
jgi:hypothetical protein